MLKLDMPGTENGVDVYPESAQPLDYPDYAGRLKRYGTALRSGESTIVTKVKVKDKLIEFQLAGGGYGTFGDDNNPTVTGSGWKASTGYRFAPMCRRITR